MLNGSVSSYRCASGHDRDELQTAGDTLERSHVCSEKAPRGLEQQRVHDALPAIIAPDLCHLPNGAVVTDGVLFQPVRRPSRLGHDGAR